MKSAVVSILLLMAGFSGSIAQSRSFHALENKFSACDGVSSFETSGFLARTVLWLAGEHEFTNAIRQVKNIRLITIPKSSFQAQSLSVHGFRKLLPGDHFEELASLREDGQQVNIYLQALENSSLNRYMILIDNPEQLVAVEIKGYIDPALLTNDDQKLSYKH